MPTTRRSAARTSGPAKGQSTLTFHGKVTKNIVKDLKEPIAKPAVADAVEVKPKEEPAEDDVKADVTLDTPDVKDEKDEEPDSDEEEPEVEAAPERPEAEIKAEKVTKPQIEKYWKGIENQRIAPRIHQQDLDLNEKVLRYFDVSSQYGVSHARFCKYCRLSSVFSTLTCAPAVHRNHPYEEVAPGRSPGLESSSRGSCCPVEGGREGKH